MNYFTQAQAPCSCGKAHTCDIKSVLCGKGVLEKLPEVLASFGTTKAFILMDKNTRIAAGTQVLTLLEKARIPFTEYTFPEELPVPDEKSVGRAVMHFDPSCDTIITVGSGVLNDIGKILANTSGTPYVICATAPSMDGYASATSSMELDGLKVSLNSKCPDAIIGDTNVLKNAPMPMLLAGLGDMLAKYISICEWRISHIITEEYYCETVAQMVRTALSRCVENAEGLLHWEDDAIEAVFEGLVLSGIAATYAGVSRPVSGVEHYFSHVWDMRGQAFQTPVALHGLQCAYGTYLAVMLYTHLKTITPDKNQAIAFAEAFDFEKWCDTLNTFIGPGASTMIAQEAKDKKYDKDAHKLRLERILSHWDALLTVMEEELPDMDEMQRLFDTLNLPTNASDLKIDPDILPLTFMATKDIRDKYVLSRLVWDLGLTDKFCAKL